MQLKLLANCMPALYCNSVGSDICSLINFLLDTCIYISTFKVSLNRREGILHLSHLCSIFHFLYIDFCQAEHRVFPERLVHSSSSLLQGLYVSRFLSNLWRSLHLFPRLLISLFPYTLHVVARLEIQDPSIFWRRSFISLYFLMFEFQRTTRRYIP
jgi:hypothetical protein